MLRTVTAYRGTNLLIAVAAVAAVAIMMHYHTFKQPMALASARNVKTAQIIQQLSNAIGLFNPIDDLRQCPWLNVIFVVRCLADVMESFNCIGRFINMNTRTIMAGTGRLPNCNIMAGTGRLPNCMAETGRLPNVITRKNTITSKTDDWQLASYSN